MGESKKDALRVNFDRKLKLEFHGVSDVQIFNTPLSAENIEQFGSPEGVLRAAADTPLEELIPLGATETAEPVTVTQLVNELFGGDDISRELLNSLASASRRLTSPRETSPPALFHHCIASAQPA